MLSNKDVERPGGCAPATRRGASGSKAARSTGRGSDAGASGSADAAVLERPADSGIPPDHPDLDRFCLILQRAGRLWRRQANEALKAYNLSEATTTPLWLISRLGDGLRQRTLADHLGIEGQSLVRLLDHLESAGYAVRRDDPTDRRAKTLHLTAEGRALVDQVNAVIDRVRLSLLDGLSSEELETAAHVLDTIISSVEPNLSSRDPRAPA